MGLFLAKKFGMLNLTNVLILVIVGLIYDNFIIAFGRFIGEGNILENANYVRFWVHALFTPTLIMFAWRICSGTGFGWAKKTSWKILFGLLTIGLILYELFTTIMGLELEPKWKNGILIYDQAVGPNRSLMVIILTIVITIIGFTLMKKLHFPLLFIGTIIMISGGILTIWIKNIPIMNILEFLFMVSLLLTKQFHDQRQ